MKTFSIARGRYTINDQAALDAGAPAVQPAGESVPIDANTVEAARVRMEQGLAGLATRAAAPAPASAPTPSFTKQKTRVTRKPQVTTPAASTVASPLTVGAGDTFFFDVDDDDYAICVLRVLHADGSEDWVEFTRNGGELDSGHDAPPPAAGGAPAATGMAAPAKTASW
jgi:hypothetical protein